jgi:Tol biopolymer transport system component
VFHTSPETISTATVTRDGKRLAFVSGRQQWRGVEIGIPDGRMHALPVAGSIAAFPEWNPGGSRYLYGAYRDGRWGIDESSATDHISRCVAEVDQGILTEPRWAPDGNQFTFISTNGGSLNRPVATSVDHSCQSVPSLRKTPTISLPSRAAARDTEPSGHCLWH